MVDVILASTPERSDFVSKLIPNWVSFTVQLGALVVLIIVVMIFAYKPVRKIIEKRKDYIESNIKNSEISVTKANENYKQSEEAVLASKKKAQEILLAAEKEATVLKEKVMEETKQEVSKMKTAAQEDIEQSRKDAQEDIRKEMVSLAVSASEEILKREVNEKDNARLADDFIKELKK